MLAAAFARCVAAKRIAASRRSVALACAFAASCMIALLARCSFSLPLEGLPSGDSTTYGGGGDDIDGLLTSATAGGGSGGGGSSTAAASRFSCSDRTMHCTPPIVVSSNIG